MSANIVTSASDSVNESETPAQPQQAPPDPPPDAKGVDYWAWRYRTQCTGWHMDKVNPHLVKFIGVLAGTDESPTTAAADGVTEGDQIGKGKSIFVPLCGKTRDLAYLRCLGFRVFAVEAIAQAIHELNETDGFGLQFNKQESLFHTEDNGIVIWCGDFFECPLERWGPFDCVWDRGSFVAVEFESRRPYIDVMKRSVRGKDRKYVDFRYLLAGIDYDKNLFKGPPRAVDATDMQEYFGDWTDYKVVDIVPLPEAHKIRKLTGDTRVDEVIYLLQPKPAGL